MTINELTRIIEEFAPLSLQESYDNAGLIIGQPGQEVTGALITLDVTEAVIEEAIQNKCNLIIAHHPLIFKGIKKLNGKNPVERMVATSIKNDIAIYAAHTNLDNVQRGVNAMLCEKAGIKNCRILSAKPSVLRKLVTFCPKEFAEKVRNAMFSAGAGHIGNYDSCSFNLTGDGTFRALEGTNPFVGKINELHVEAGEKLNGSLIRAGLVDEFVVYLAPKLIGQGRGMAQFGPLPSLTWATPLEFKSTDIIGPDLRIVARVCGSDAF